MNVGDQIKMRSIPARPGTAGKTGVVTEISYPVPSESLESLGNLRGEPIADGTYFIHVKLEDYPGPNWDDSITVMSDEVELVDAEVPVAV